MEFGLNLFPSVGPAEMSGEQYWREALRLVDLVDPLGYAHVRTVEHHFHAYGGYSPNPIVFLSAASQRTKKARLITGAVLPIFNNPLKVAGEIGMLDAISGGRLDVGFARAFVPHEFAHFGRSMDESRARFEEGVQQIRLLLERGDVTSAGQFHSFRNVTSLPRPTQRPTPPLWVAAFGTPESFVFAGKSGFNIMAIPLGGARMAELIAIYREAWRSAGHPGRGKVQISFSMCCLPTTEAAIDAFRGPMTGYVEMLVGAASSLITGTPSKDYQNYDKMIAAIRDDDFDHHRARGTIWVGSPAEIRRTIAEYRVMVEFDSASLHVKPRLMPVEIVAESLRLFAGEVIPHLRDA
jgi:alkanesulfonate monooxygenase SsuD/methylene tetrahydromethanopterin reductase-like flavin-dependent oxidoreductase (luciferase family)